MNRFFSLPFFFAVQSGVSLLQSKVDHSSWWDLERTAMQVLFLGMFLLIARRLGKILNRADRLDEQTRLDRVAREQALSHLTHVANDLKRQTEEIALAKASVDDSRADRFDDRLNELARGIAENTGLTREATSASKEAAHVANDMNKKIDKTNTRLLEHVEKEDTK